MPVPHFNIKITQRSKGNSAVAGAAYQAGEKLFSEYDQKTKNYTCKKEVVYTEIMLPPNAPPEYADRATLWNSVEEIEKQWNSQLARRFVAALPREVPMELLPQMVKEYCEEQFVSKGMCCDFAIHDPDPPGHNPHCHFMLTMRAIDENGKWMPKSRKVYDLDENGERIKLPSGRWKSHKEDTVDWNEQYHAEEWRHGWEIVQNKYLELAGSPERIDPADKTITINEEEAAVVRYIFQRYTEGAGGSVIAKELENLGYKTKRGSPKWADSTVIGIIKNEKYKGDILLGKTFTVDPISKRRLYNFGEEDQFYIREHHEPIISEEVFEAAQEILRRRAKPRSLNVDGKREKFSRKYAFSCMIECGFCGGTLTRRSWHSSSQYNKAIWQCVVSTKKGKKFCPESKGVDERTIERAFVESYRLLCQNNKDVLDEFMKRTEEALSESNAGKRLAKAEKDIHALEVKKNKLVDMRLEDTIDKETYDRKYLDLSSQIEQLQKECESLQDAAETESTMRKRVATFRQTLEQNEVLDTFDRHIFESIVEKVIVGGYDSNGNKDPYMIVFVYKTGFKNSVDGKNFKPLRKNSKENHSPAVLCSHASNEAESMCSDSNDDTCRSRSPFDQAPCRPPH